ncbi:hypothetical protein PG996_008642 [Apiospora saccharicola]|uniref:Uncharacterized protein n=1 Tax=Apiospora saccharicola TaxID=335842 RepID=A0ABR1UYI3_9PEZI
MPKEYNAGPSWAVLKADYLLGVEIPRLSSSFDLATDGAVLFPCLSMTARPEYLHHLPHNKMRVRMLTVLHIPKRAKAACVSPAVDATLSAALLLLEAGRVLLATDGIRENLLDKPIGDRAKRRLLSFRRRLHTVSRKGLEVWELFLGYAPVLNREPLSLFVKEGLPVGARQRCAEDEAAVHGLPQAQAPGGRVFRMFGDYAVEDVATVSLELPNCCLHGVYAVVQVQDTMELFER